MGIGFGLIQGLTKAATGIQEGKSRAKEMEQKALHEAMQRRLLEAQITKMQAPQQGPGQYFTDDQGNVTYSTGGAQGQRVQGVQGRKTQDRTTPDARPLVLGPGAKLVDAQGREIAQGNPKANPKQSPGIVQKVATNNQQMKVIDDALSGLTTRPEGVGAKGLIPDFFLQRLDPKGVDLRANIADIGSLKIHDRSGAAVTVSEAPRLKPFIPLTTDTPEAARKKLQRLRDLLKTETDFLSQTPVTDEAGNEMAVPGQSQNGASDRARAALQRVRGS